MALDKLSCIVFPGGFNWPIWAAQERGFFARRQLDVALHPTASSMEQLAGIIEGKYDIGMTAIDNVIAYMEGQGEASVTATPDLFTFMGGDHGFLRLVVQGSIGSFADLKGKQLAVDAMTTGFAFVLRKMIERAGIKESEVEYVRAGGAVQRFEALKAGKFAGSLLLPPFELIGQKLGMRVLQSSEELFPHYQGVIGAARRGWARTHGGKLVAFVHGYLDGLDWLYDRANKAAAIELLLSKMPAMTPPLAEATYGVLLADKNGLNRSAAIDRTGIETVLALRSQYGMPAKRLTDPGKYLDLTFYDAAIKSRGR
jgi:ABC-type nitrate/sulfonate/bicarbonate transport system substrate-binding protein